MSNKPNILVLTSHDLGRHLGCYGQKSVSTPNIDKLAAEGIRFANHFCSAPQCSPSRAAMATGRYPHANGVMGLSHLGWEFNAGEEHIAELLASNGYQTAGFGVLHESSAPGTHGFEICEPQAQPAEKLAEQVVSFLERSRDASRPFYLQAGFFEPHRPFDYGDCPVDDSKGVSVPDYLVDDESARAEFAGYQGAVRQLDRGVGRIAEALEQLGLTEDTLVIFTTDHGIPFPRAKCSAYDAGIEAALIVRWPGRSWSGGRVFDELLSNVDLFPTLLQAADLPLPDNLHGRSFTMLCDGRAFEPRSEVFGEMTWHIYYDPIRFIRTDTHKLIVNFSTAFSFMDPSQNWHPKTITVYPANPAAAKHPPIELYDLRADPLERNNLADEEQQAPLRRELLARLSKWMRETGDPLLEGPIPAPLHHAGIAALRDAENG